MQDPFPSSSTTTSTEPPVVHDTAAVTTKKTRKKKQPSSRPPATEESRFEAALCLVNLQRPVASTNNESPPSHQQTQQNQPDKCHPPPIVAIPLNSSPLNNEARQPTTLPLLNTSAVAVPHPPTTNPPQPQILCWPAITQHNRSGSDVTANAATSPKRKKKRIRLNYRCTHSSGCTNLVRKSGVCIRHGAAVKLCSHPNGCTNHAKNGGVCRRHGASRPCGRIDCSNMVVKQGLCIKHWREKFDYLKKVGSGADSGSGSRLEEEEEEEREVVEVAAVLAWTSS